MNETLETQDKTIKTLKTIILEKELGDGIHNAYCHTRKLITLEDILEFVKTEVEEIEATAAKFRENNND